MIYIRKMLGTHGHLRNGAIGVLGGGKVFQEEGTTAGRLRTAWYAQIRL